MNRKFLPFLIALLGCWLPNTQAQSPQDEQIKFANQDTFTADLLFVEGGTFMMGEGKTSRRVTVSSFYIEETEVSNLNYRHFIEWTQRWQPNVNISELLPDTTLWTKLISGEVGKQLANDYFRKPAFDYYPVVGVSWAQAQKYCSWRTDRTNEKALMAQGFLKEPSAFSTQAYYKSLPNTPESRATERPILPAYRIPTEAEWEYAAQIGRIFPRDERDTIVKTSPKIKTPKSNLKNWVLAHNKKHPVPSYYDHQKYKLPKHIFAAGYNNAKLWNIEGNVSEWMQDAYRPREATTTIDNEIVDLNPAKMDTSFFVNKPQKTEYQAVERVIKGQNFTKMPTLQTLGGRDQYFEEKSAVFLGFRCAMIRIGSPRYKTNE